MINVPKSLSLSLAEYQEKLAEAEAFHGHVCYGMFSGVKMAMAAQLILDYPVFPAHDLIVVTEIDRCLTDAVMSVTGCRFGRRSLKFQDWGKFAATFFSLDRGEGVRLAQRDGIVRRMEAVISERGIDRHDRVAMAPVVLEIPVFEHFAVSVLPATFRPEELPGKPSIKINCNSCGETVMDGKHIDVHGALSCRPCAVKAGWREPAAV